MNLYEWFYWVEQQAVGDAIRNSLWLFPAIEAVHLVGFALLGGSVLVMDLRMVNLIWRDKQPVEVFTNTKWVFRAALFLVIMTGVPLAMSEMVKLYYNFSFWVKFWSFLSALGFTFLVRNPIARAHSVHPIGLAIVGVVSTGLWFTVAAAGRWIGFS